MRLYRRFAEWYLLGTISGLGQQDIEHTMANWKHPGGKLREEGPAALSEAELLAILISTGIPGRSAEQIAADVLAEYGSLSDLSGRPLDELLRFKGLSDVKVIRIAAALAASRARAGWKT